MTLTHGTALAPTPRPAVPGPKPYPIVGLAIVRDQQSVADRSSRPMSDITNRQYLVSDQYRDASNLEARIEVHRRFSTNRYGWQRWVFDHLRLGPEAAVLELGCGPANLWAENLTRVPTGWEVTLTDLSPGMLDRARESLGEAAGRFSFRPVDAADIPFRDASFDAVIANHMLYHVADLDRALSEIRRVLRPGGRLYASTVGRDHLTELDAAYRRCGLDAFIVSNAQVAEAFGLETGGPRLERWFSDVTLYRYEDSLRVAEASLLVAYARSALRSNQLALPELQLAQFARFVDNEIAARGYWHITKSSGLFEAIARLG